MSNTAGVNKRMYSILNKVSSVNKINNVDNKDKIVCLAAAEELISILGQRCTQELARSILLCITDKQAALPEMSIAETDEIKDVKCKLEASIKALTPADKKELAAVFNISKHFHFHADERVDKVLAKVQQAKLNYSIAAGELPAVHQLQKTPKSLSNQSIREDGLDVYHGKMAARGFYTALGRYLTQRSQDEGINSEQLAKITKKIINFNSLVDISMRKQSRFKLDYTEHLKPIADKVFDEIHSLDPKKLEMMTKEEFSKLLIYSTIYSNFHRNVGSLPLNILKSVALTPVATVAAAAFPITIASAHLAGDGDGVNQHLVLGAVVGATIGGVGGAVAATVVAASVGTSVTAGFGTGVAAGIGAVVGAVAGAAGGAVAGVVVGSGTYAASKIGKSKYMNAGDSMLKNTNSSNRCLEHLLQDNAEQKQLRLAQKKMWLSFCKYSELNDANKLIEQMNNEFSVKLLNRR